MHSSDGLIETVKQAEQNVRVGGLYAHYPTPERLYKVLAIGINEKTEEPCVIYQALYADQLIWVRPLSAWFDSIEYDQRQPISGEFSDTLVYAKYSHEHLPLLTVEWG